MKIVIALLTLGVLEVYIVTLIHARFSFWEMAGMYLLTSLIGLLLVKLTKSRFKNNQPIGRKTAKKIEHKIKAKVPLTEKELVQFESSLFEMSFVFSIIFILIPGFITDLAGVLLLLPWVKQSWIDKAMKGVSEDLKTSGEN